MDTLLINGSPKKRRSASGLVLEGLKKLLQNERNINITQVHIYDENCKIDASGYDRIVLAFPLYVDAVPAHLLQPMEQISGNAHVYAVLNCRFFEGHQNKWALQILENWCNKKGLAWCGGLGIGGGGMLPMMGDITAGKGPAASISPKLAELADSIVKEQPFETSFVSPAFPRFMYMLAAQMQWRKQIRKNGMKCKDLGKRP